MNDLFKLGIVPKEQALTKLEDLREMGLENDCDGDGDIKNVFLIDKAVDLYLKGKVEESKNILLGLYTNEKNSLLIKKKSIFFLYEIFKENVHDDKDEL
jgi:hypothetical protein